MEVNIKRIEQGVIEEIFEQILRETDISDTVNAVVRTRTDKLFAEIAEKIIQDNIESAITDVLDKEYRKVDNFGKPKGDPTTIKTELNKLVSEYWSQPVDSRGEPIRKDSYTKGKTRAEYVLINALGKDFEKEFTKSVPELTKTMMGEFKNTVLKEVDKIMNSAFRSLN